MTMAIMAPPPPLLRRSPLSLPEIAGVVGGAGGGVGAPRPLALGARCPAVGEVPAADHHVAEEGEDAGEHDRDHHQLRVAVADVGELVRQHGLELVVAQRVEEATGDRHHIAALAQAGGVGVEGGRIDDLQRRHRQPARDAQILQDVVEPRRLRAGDAPGAGGAADQALVHEIGDGEPGKRRDHGKGPRARELADGAGNDLVQGAAEERAPDQQHGEQQRM